MNSLLTRFREDVVDEGGKIEAEELSLEQKRKVTGLPTTHVVTSSACIGEIVSQHL